MSKQAKKKAELKRLQKARRQRKIAFYRDLINRKFLLFPDPGFTAPSLPPLVENEEEDVEFIIDLQNEIVREERRSYRSLVFRSF